MQISIIKSDGNYSFQYLKSIVVVVVFSLFLIHSVQASSVYYSVMDYDAKGDGIVLDTEAIQKAIDAANENGGGTVFFPAGKYLDCHVFS